MSDSDSREVPGLTAEINSSLSAVWGRYATVRPKGAETEISDNVVRCTFTDSVKSFEQGMSEDADAGENGHGRTVTTYERDASAAVAKATHRRVLAFISKHDEKTDAATEVFILDSAPQRTVRVRDHRTAN